MGQGALIDRAEVPYGSSPCHKHWLKHFSGPRDNPTRLTVVVGIVYAGEAADADAAKGHHAGVAQVEDARRGPSTIVQLPQVVGCLVVAADCAARLNTQQKAISTAYQARGERVNTRPTLLQHGSSVTVVTLVRQRQARPRHSSV